MRAPAGDHRRLNKCFAPRRIELDTREKVVDVTLFWWGESNSDGVVGRRHTFNNVCKERKHVKGLWKNFLPPVMYAWGSPAATEKAFPGFNSKWFMMNAQKTPLSSGYISCSRKTRGLTCFSAS